MYIVIWQSEQLNFNIVKMNRFSIKYLDKIKKIDGYYLRFKVNFNGEETITEEKETARLRKFNCI